MKRIGLGACVVFVVGCVTGCKSTGPMTPEQAQAMQQSLEMVTQFARDNNVQVIGHLEIAEPGGELVQGVRLSGVRAVFHFAANPSSRTTVPVGFNDPKEWWDAQSRLAKAAIADSKAEPQSAEKRELAQREVAKALIAWREAEPFLHMQPQGG